MIDPGLAVLAALGSAAVGFIVGEQVKRCPPPPACPVCPTCHKPKKDRRPGWKKDADNVLDVAKQGAPILGVLGKSIAMVVA